MSLQALARLITLVCLRPPIGVRLHHPDDKIASEQNKRRSLPSSPAELVVGRSARERCMADTNPKGGTSKLR